MAVPLPPYAPGEVLDDVARVLRREVTVAGRRPGGVNGGAVRVLVGGGSLARVSAYSSDVSALVERLRLVCADVPPPPAARDMVHADLSTASNVLVREGVVVAVVDIGNAGSGTRAIDLTGLVWQALPDPRLDAVRGRLWTRILDIVGWEGAAVLAAAEVLHRLEISIRHGQDDLVGGVVERGHRTLDELIALR
jgi:aminoglycoside phosphotransferase (APT) family kinase protein